MRTASNRQPPPLQPKNSFWEGGEFRIGDGEVVKSQDGTRNEAQDRSNPTTTSKPTILPKHTAETSNRASLRVSPWRADPQSPVTAILGTRTNTSRVRPSASLPLKSISYQTLSWRRRIPSLRKVPKGLSLLASSLHLECLT